MPAGDDRQAGLAGAVSATHRRGRCGTAQGAARSCRSPVEEERGARVRCAGRIAATTSAVPRGEHAQAEAAIEALRGTSIPGLPATADNIGRRHGRARWLGRPAGVRRCAFAGRHRDAEAEQTARARRPGRTARRRSAPGAREGRPKSSRSRSASAGSRRSPARWRNWARCSIMKCWCSSIVPTAATGVEGVPNGGEWPNLDLVLASVPSSPPAWPGSPAACAALVGPPDRAGRGRANAALLVRRRLRITGLRSARDLRAARSRSARRERLDTADRLSAAGRKTRKEGSALVVIGTPSDAELGDADTGRCRNGARRRSTSCRYQGAHTRRSPCRRAERFVIVGAMHELLGVHPACAGAQRQRPQPVAAGVSLETDFAEVWVGGRDLESAYPDRAITTSA